MSPDLPASSGRLIVVVGASGVGKDSLIAYARERLAELPALMFVQRVVTREGSASAEDHAVMTTEAFDETERAGGFAVSWHAHGLRYGLPVEICSHLDGGGIAVANGSRAALAAIRQRFPDCVIVNVSARPDILAQRLADRGRESGEDIQQRLQRAVAPFDYPDGTIDIDNSGPLEQAGDRFLSIVLDMRAVSPPAIAPSVSARW